MNKYASEIIDLHQFFEDWFAGRLENTEAAFARFADVTAPDFHIVSPSGRLTARAELVARLRNAYNTRDETRIWIDNVQVRVEHDDISIVTYEEWQQSADKPDGRLSTVVFRATPSAINGLVWLHVHETWLPQSEV